MKIEKYYNRWLWGAVLMMVPLMGVMPLLTSCAADDDIDGGEKPVQLVTARLNFSLPTHIVGKKKAQTTRMTGDVVQADGEDGDFRGIDDIHMLCYNEVPTASSNKVGNVIEMNTKSNDVTDEVTKDDYAISKEIDVPVGTSYFGFYANAEEEPVTGMTEHERRMHYGVIKAVGIDKYNYQGNSAIRFKPVPICTSNDKLGGSAIGEALLNLLNLLMKVEADVAAPNNRWATANNLYLNEAYQRMTQLTTLSSYNVQVMLGAILKIITQPEGENQVDKYPDGQGRELAEAIKELILDKCDPESTPDIANGVITLKDTYQGYPGDIHLPAGAARIQWNEAADRFEPASVQAYGKELNVPSVNDYVYPMSLQYQIFSDIVASDELVINSVNEEGEIVPPESAEYKNWSELLEKGYGEDAEKSVQPTTRSVAMVHQVEYGVGRLALRARLEKNVNYYDAKGQFVEVSAGFKLKGYIVGGQHEVDYDFKPIEDSHVYAIYDTDLNMAEDETEVRVKPRVFQDDDTFEYILGLGSLHTAPIYLAMELENDGPDFWGADGIIAHGATFYLVAEMDPSQSKNYSPGSLDQVFIKDHYTKVNLVIAPGYPDIDGDGKPDPGIDDVTGQPKPINGLATATYGLPNLEVPHPTVGLSVDLSWGQGLWFDEVEL